MTLALSAALAPISRATILDFEGLGDDSTVPYGYGGFAWSEFFFSMDTSLYSGPSGYHNGLVSGQNVAFSAYEQDVFFGLDSGFFDLKSLYLTAAWDNGLKVAITGHRLGSVVYSTEVIVDTTAPTQLVLNWAGVDKVSFHSEPGVPAGYSGYGKHFVIDDIEVNSVGAVPEPFSLALGLGGLALAARRRRR